jgi:hypothetical protein
MNVSADWLSPKNVIMKPIYQLCLVSVLIGAHADCATVAASGSLLTNSGFETGNLSGWTVGGKNGGIGVLTDGARQPVTSALPDSPNFFFQSWQNVRSGVFGGYAITAGDGQALFSEVATFSQVILAPPNTYRLGFFMGTDNELGGIGVSSALDDLRLAIFVDGRHVTFQTPDFSNPFSTNLSGGSTADDFVEFSSEVTLSGVHTIEFRISAGGTKRVGISVDDFFVTPIPEPGSLLLLFSSIWLVMKRRRI